MAAQKWKRKGSTFSLRRTSSKDNYVTVPDGLKSCYRKILRPFEEASGFHTFHSPPMEDPDFDSKPIVLLLGQYSTGERCTKFYWFFAPFSNIVLFF